jgi:hypothetical protein
MSPEGAKDSSESFAPSGLTCSIHTLHGLAPVAKVFRRSAAQQGRGYRRAFFITSVYANAQPGQFRSQTAPSLDQQL